MKKKRFHVVLFAEHDVIVEAETPEQAHAAALESADEKWELLSLQRLFKEGERAREVQPS